MLYKRQYLEAQLRNLPIFLKFIIADFERMSLEFGIEPVVTRVSGKVSGESGVHGDRRAIDLRDQYRGQFKYTEHQRMALANYINAKYPRNDGKPTCLWHSFKGMPHHFHLQLAVKTTAY